MLITDQLSNKKLPGKSYKAPSLDLAFGAQNGYMPKLGGVKGKNFAEWVSSAPHAACQIIAIPLATPGFYDIVAKPQQARALKKMWADVFSVYPKSISGFDSKLSLNTGEIQIGPSESLFLETGLKVVRNRSTISYSFDERLNKPITDFLDWNLINAEGHDKSQASLISTLPEVRKYMKSRVWSPDLKTGVILYVELDVLNVNVVDAWLVGNILNKGGGDHTGKKDITGGRELVTFDVEVTSLVETGDYINMYAQHVVDNMAVFRRNPETDIPLFINKDIANATIGHPDGAGFNEKAGLDNEISMG